jgi:hypothetical protein
MRKWLSGYGYAGEPYCQRCSEIFRDHLIRQKSNSAKCGGRGQQIGGSGGSLEPPGPLS